MSQAHGRYSGSRDKGQRQSRQPSKATSHQQKKPFVKAPPTRDPAQTASIFKTRSFKWFCRDNGGRTSLIDIVRTTYITSE